MAIMARTLGIPARVAVGFLSGEEIGAQRWQFSAHDMHAWPELFFPGSGWVRFEPTPSAGPASDVRATTVPPYTDVDLEVLPVPSAEPSGNQATEELPNRGADPAADDASGDDTATDGSSGILSPWMWRLGGGLLAAIALVGLAYVPQLLRRARRERRWRTGGAQAAWEELRDTAVDLGVIWRPGLSPRAMRTRLVEHFGAPPDSATPERPPRGPAANPGPSMPSTASCTRSSCSATPVPPAAPTPRASASTPSCAAPLSPVGQRAPPAVGPSGGHARCSAVRRIRARGRQPTSPP